MEFAVDLAKNYGKNRRITSAAQPGPRDRRPRRERRRLRPLPHRRRVRRPARAQRHDPPGGTGVDRSARPAAPTCARTAASSTARTPPTAAARALAATPGGFGLGVDLNRNYGGFWGGPGAGRPCQAGPDLPRRRRRSRSRRPRTSATSSAPPDHDDDLQPHVLEPGAAPQRRQPDHHRSRRQARRRRPRRGGAQGARRQDGRRRTATPTSTAGSSTTPPAPPRTTPTTPPAASATPSRSAPTSSTRRSPRSSTSTSARAIRRQGQPRGLPDRPRARRRHPLQRRADGQGPAAAPRPAEEDLQDADLGGLVQGRREHHDQRRSTGRFTWIVNPSTRPVVQPRPYQVLATTPFATKTLRGRARRRTATPTTSSSPPKTPACSTSSWTGPRRTTSTSRSTARSDGKLVEVGSLGQLRRREGAGRRRPTPPAGTYVLRVINYASATPSYTLDVELFDARHQAHAGPAESYVLTCESRNGKVLQTQRIFVDRGQVKKLDLASAAASAELSASVSPATPAGSRSRRTGRRARAPRRAWRSRRRPRR